MIYRGAPEKSTICAANRHKKTVKQNFVLLVHFCGEFEGTTIGDVLVGPQESPGPA